MYETITKFAVKGGSSRIPILFQINVENEAATVTDLDLYITLKCCNIKEGMYHAHGFDKGIYIKSDFPITDFPAPSKHDKNILGETTLYKTHMDVFAWALKAASTDECRYYLNGVYFEDNTVVSTDGHRCHSFRHPVKWEEKKKNKTGAFEGAIMPTKACKAIIDMMKELSADKAEIHFHKLWFRCFIDECIIEGKLIDGAYPAWRKVIPKTDKETAFDPDEIKELMPELKAAMKAHGVKTPVLVFCNGFADASHHKYKRAWPVLCNFENHKIGFNANYMAELCGGILHYKEQRGESIKIIDRRGGIEKMALLMPVRVEDGPMVDKKAA